MTDSPLRPVPFSDNPSMKIRSTRTLRLTPPNTPGLQQADQLGGGRDVPDVDAEPEDAGFLARIFSAMSMGRWETSNSAISVSGSARFEAPNDNLGMRLQFAEVRELVTEPERTVCVSCVQCAEEDLGHSCGVRFGGGEGEAAERRSSAQETLPRAGSGRGGEPAVLE